MNACHWPCNPEQVISWKLPLPHLLGNQVETRAHNIWHIEGSSSCGSYCLFTWSWSGYTQTWICWGHIAKETGTSCVSGWRYCYFMKNSWRAVCIAEGNLEGDTEWLSQIFLSWCLCILKTPTCKTTMPPLMLHQAGGADIAGCSIMNSLSCGNASSSCWSSECSCLSPWIQDFQFHPLEITPDMEKLGNSPNVQQALNNLWLCPYKRVLCKP